MKDCGGTLHNFSRCLFRKRFGKGSLACPVNQHHPYESRREGGFPLIELLVVTAGEVQGAKPVCPLAAPMTAGIPKAKVL
jgi:hypothetical protein